MSLFHIFWILLICFASNTSFAQKNDPANRLKTGKFYYYSKKTGHDYLIIRKNGIQKEIDLQNHDTTNWKMEWVNEKLLGLTFISSSEKLSEGEFNFYKTGKVYIRIDEVKRSYYTFKGSTDSSANAALIADTIWFKPRKYAIK